MLWVLAFPREHLTLTFTRSEVTHPCPLAARERKTGRTVRRSRFGSGDVRPASLAKRSKTMYVAYAALIVNDHVSMRLVSALHHLPV